MNNITISIVVPTFHRNNLLDRCLKALIAQDLDPGSFEIIVVDDANSLDTRTLVEKWVEKTSAYGLDTEIIDTRSTQEREQNSTQATTSVRIFSRTVANLTHFPLIRYLPMIGPAHGPAAARNLGWKSASGEVIAFTDDDCIPQPTWLRMGLEAILNGADGVSGQIIVPLGDKPTDYEWNAGGLSRSVFVTANCFYRRSVLQYIGGFDEQFKIAWREDTDLFFTIFENGFTLIQDSQAVVIHPTRAANWGISLSQQRKNLYNALLFKKHPQLYRKMIQSRPPFIYYVAMLSLLFSAASFLAGYEAYSWIGLAIWFGTISLFCIRRLQRTNHQISHILEMAITSIFIPPLAIYWRIRGALRYHVIFF